VVKRQVIVPCFFVKLIHFYQADISPSILITLYLAFINLSLHG